MQANIAMKFAEYVVWNILCKHCYFGEKIYNSSRDIEFFLGGYFFWCSLYIYKYTCCCPLFNRKNSEYKWLKMCIYYNINKSRVVTRKLCDAACFSYIQRLFNCYLLHVSKGQGHDDNGLANVKLNICCICCLDVKLKIK